MSNDYTFIRQIYACAFLSFISLTFLFFKNFIGLTLTRKFSQSQSEPHYHFRMLRKISSGVKMPPSSKVAQKQEQEPVPNMNPHIVPLHSQESRQTGPKVYLRLQKSMWFSHSIY